MIEREVTDLINVTFAVTGLTILMRDEYNFSDHQFIFTSLVLLILTSFGHVIGRQMELIDNNLSNRVSLLNVLGSLILLISYFLSDIENSDGFWNDIGMNLREFYIIIIFIIIISSFMSVPAKLDDKGKKSTN